MASTRWQKNVSTSLTMWTHHPQQQKIDNQHISLKTLNPKCNTKNQRKTSQIL
jgi:hypothetical protein